MSICQVIAPAEIPSATLRPIPILCWLHRIVISETQRLWQFLYRSFIIYSPFDGNNINGVESSSKSIENQDSFSRSSFSLSTEYLKITLSNLQKEEIKNSIIPRLNTCVTYLVTTRTNIPDSGGFEFNVWRWFRDVVTLADRWAELYGFFLFHQGRTRVW